MINLLIEIFNNNFGLQTIHTILVILIVIHIVISITNLSKIKKQILLMVSLITFIFILGLIFIHTILGVQDYPKFSITIDNKNYNEIFICQDRWARLGEGKPPIRYIVGYELSCKFINEHKLPFNISNYSINLTFTNLNDKIIKLNSDGSKEIHFKIPKQLSHIGIKGKIIDNANNIHTLSSGFPIDVYTKEQDRERSKDFLTYFLALLGACIVAIPNFVKTLKEIGEN